MNLESLKHIDCHTHLNFDQFDDDREKIIAEMKEKRVGAINVGINQQTSQESITLAENHDHIWASVGCHPTEAYDDFNLDAYRTLTEKSDRVVAVGECGLDYSRSEYRSSKQKDVQEKVFIEQIKLAAEMGLPLILHIRPQEGSMDAYEDALDILTHFQEQASENMCGTAHFFVGSKDIAKQFIELGFYVSFTGPLTFDKRLQSVCAYVPDDNVLAETDSPFAAPEPYRGQRNNSMYVTEIVKTIAAINENDQDMVQQQIRKNTQTLFGLTS